MHRCKTPPSLIILPAFVLPTFASTMQTSTRILHEGDDRSAQHGAVNPPVYFASTFVFPTVQAFNDAMADPFNHYFYSRDRNPTVQALEDKLALLEGAEGCICSASGMGAITAAILVCVKAGDHALVVDTCYGPTRRFMDRILAGLGVSTTYYPPETTDLGPWLQPNTRLVYLESPGSLSFHIQDLPGLAAQARSHGAATIADNSWATPLYQQPHRLGVDIVVHSGTKYIAGHSDLLLGVLTTSGDFLRRAREVSVLSGATLGPAEAYLALRGLRTLPVRMSQHQASGLAVARWLQDHPKVRRVLHPGLPDFPGHALAQTQFSGWSSLFSIELHAPTSTDHRHRFVDGLRFFSIGVSWGGYESLIIPLESRDPASAAARRRVGLNEECYRLSVGLEDPNDLIADLAQALKGYQVQG